MERLIHRQDGGVIIAPREIPRDDLPEELAKLLKKRGYFGKHGKIIGIEDGYIRNSIRKTITFEDGYFCSFHWLTEDGRVRYRRYGYEGEVPEWERGFGTYGHRRINDETTYEVRFRVRLPILDNPREFFKDFISKATDEAWQAKAVKVREINRVPIIDWGRRPNV